MGKIIFHYFIAAISVAVNLFCAWGVAQIIGNKCPKLKSNKHLSSLLIVSTVVLLIAGIGKLGWSIQTWDGESMPEHLNDVLFWAFSHIGTFLLFIHIFLSTDKK